MKKTAVIVLHFGSIPDTLQCLESFEKIKRKNFSLYVIDNGTNMLQSNMLHEFSYNPKLIVNKQNLGYAGGNNIGIKKALKEKHEFILLLNNDTVVSPNAIDELLSPFQDRTIGITGCVITYANAPQKIWFAGGILNKKLCITRHPFMNKSLQEIKPRAGETDFITGAAMMVKSDVFKKIGLLSEDYFLYWEDVDFCYRAKRKGYVSFLVNKALVKHSVSAASGDKGSNLLSPLRAYYYARNPFLFMKKNKMPVSGLLGQFVVRFPYNMLLLKNVNAAKSYAKGIVDGLYSLGRSK